MLISETERLRVETWKQEHWEAFRELGQNPAVMRYISNGDLWDDDFIQKWVSKQIYNQEQRGFCRWRTVLKENNELVGFCGLGRFGTSGEIEIGWWVKESLWGQGLATEAAIAVYAYALEKLNLKRIISVAVPENMASMKVMEKIGLTFEKDCLGRDMGIPQEDLPIRVYSNGQP